MTFLTYLTAKMELIGAKCTFQHFLYGFAPNVICTYPSLHESDEHVILSAHYDSRGSFGIPRAPGGDDDASGSGHLLGVAEAIFDQRVEFHKTVVLAFFAGEEQGLFGSQAYAGETGRTPSVPCSWWVAYLHGQNATVLLEIQADMLAYHNVRILA